MRCSLKSAHCVAEVGNAMGLVRLMRAGSMHYCAAAMRQVPGEEQLQPFAAAAQQLPEQPSDAHLAAAQTLDDALAQLRTHASAGERVPSPVPTTDFLVPFLLPRPTQSSMQPYLLKFAFARSVLPSSR